MEVNKIPSSNEIDVIIIDDDEFRNHSREIDKNPEDFDNNDISVSNDFEAQDDTNDSALDKRADYFTKPVKHFFTYDCLSPIRETNKRPDFIPKYKLDCENINDFFNPIVDLETQSLVNQPSTSGFVKPSTSKVTPESSISNIFTNKPSTSRNISIETPSTSNDNNNKTDDCRDTCDEINLLVNEIDSSMDEKEDESLSNMMSDTQEYKGDAIAVDDNISVGNEAEISNTSFQIEHSFHYEPDPMETCSENDDDEALCVCLDDESSCDEHLEDGNDDKPLEITVSDDELNTVRKRKNDSPSSVVSKRMLRSSRAFSSSSDCQIVEVETESPPGVNAWLTKFTTWFGSERSKAIELLIKKCSADQVRHMMETIEPLFQRDFISHLPKEVALQILKNLSPNDLLRAAQTSRYWRFLSDDNLLWKEQCLRIGITSISKRIRLMPISFASSWKAEYMRNKYIEHKWLTKPMSSAKILKAHDDHVITCLQFYGNIILSGSDDTTLKLWSAITGKCLRTLVGHTGGVWSSQMYKKTVISGSTDRTLRVWDADSGACLKILTGHTSTVRCMHLHEDRVVSGSRDATLRVWSVSEGQCLNVLVGHLAAVRCVQYDGKLVVSGAYDYYVKVWNPESGECLHTLAGHTNRVYSLQFDGHHIVSGSLDTSIIVWDVVSGSIKHSLTGHQSLTSGMELRDNILVSGNADSTVKVWDIITGQCLHTLAGAHKHQSAVTCLQLNNRFVITSSDDGTVKLWDVKTGEFIRNLVTLESGGSGGVVWRIRASQTKLVCAVGSRNGTEETKLMVLNFDVPRNCQACHICCRVGKSLQFKLNHCNHKI